MSKTLMKGVAAGAAAAAVLAPGLAMAQNAWGGDGPTTVRPGFYAAVQGGFNAARDHDFETSLGEVDSSLDDGYAVGAALGYNFGQVWPLGGLRLEAEWTYRENDVDNHEIGGADVINPTGSIESHAFMANLYHDFLPGAAINPYIGAGIGMAELDFKNYGANVAGANVEALDDSDSVMAYQAIAGLAFAINQNLSLTADYRYFTTEKAEVTAAVDNGTDTRYRNHTLMAGLRYSF